MSRTPEAVLAAYFAHMSAGEYDAAAALVAPICIERFAEHEAPHLRPPPRESLEEYVARNEGLPRGVSEHFHRVAQERPRSTMSDYFAGVESEEELASLGQRDLYARRLQATDPGHRYRVVLEQLADRHPEYAAQLRALGADHEAWAYDILGSVEVGDRAMVLFEHPLGETSAGELRWEPTPAVAATDRKSTRLNSSHRT